MRVENKFGGLGNLFISFVFFLWRRLHHLTQKTLAPHDLEWGGFDEYSSHSMLRWLSFQAKDCSPTRLRTKLQGIRRNSVWVFRIYSRLLVARTDWISLLISFVGKYCMMVTVVKWTNDQSWIKLLMNQKLEPHKKNVGLKSCGVSSHYISERLLLMDRLQ